MSIFSKEYGMKLIFFSAIDLHVVFGFLNVCTFFSLSLSLIFREEGLKTRQGVNFQSNSVLKTQLVFIARADQSSPRPAVIRDSLLR